MINMEDLDTQQFEDKVYLSEDSITAVSIALELRNDETLPVFDPVVSILEKAV